MKKRQVTDNIHGTIYLSQLESKLISTPYFYRLNDIYQSSTVYMTFPSNRTKRYEHSLGAMELTSSMFFSSINNATLEAKQKLFHHLKAQFNNLSKLIMECDSQRSIYFSTCSEDIDYFFDKIKNTSNGDLHIEQHIENAMSKGSLKDFALDNFQYYPIENGQGTSIIDEFLYYCLLQSLRVVSLFHDVGHPPYSHIIEDVLNSLYNLAISNEKSKSWNSTKKETLISRLKPYLSHSEKDFFFCDRLIGKMASKSKAPHERIGLDLLQHALDDVIRDNIRETIKSSADDSSKLSLMFYYIIVAEFATAIFVDYDNFFSSFHKLIDGVLDSDRLDYIVRDMTNSGVDWGKIPYKRVVNSSKLILLDDEVSESEDSSPKFAIAFPRKITNDIEDLLLVRYKIFARINFHHRCIKTSSALKSAVLELAINYLLDKEKDINPDIATLWTALENGIGNKKTRIIKWNDSWLISALHTALIRIKTENFGQKYNLLEENLEEILLNKKRYYSLLKRGDDNRDFVKQIFNYSEISDSYLNRLLLMEQKKFFDHSEDEVSDEEILTAARFNASDSILRITTLIDAKQQGDLELLQGISTFDSDRKFEEINSIIKSSLESLKQKKDIVDYKIIFNSDRKKMGLPKHTNLWDEIYLYNDDTIFKYDEQELLAPQIKAIERTVPWLYIYFIPPREETDISLISSNIKDTLARDVAAKFKIYFNELFPIHQSQTLVTAQGGEYNV